MTNSLYESITNFQGNANQVYNEITPVRVTRIKKPNKLQNKQTSKKNNKTKRSKVLAKMRRSQCTLVHCWWEYKML